MWLVRHRRSKLEAQSGEFHLVVCALSNRDMRESIDDMNRDTDEHRRVRFGSLAAWQCGMQSLMEAWN